MKHPKTYYESGKYYAVIMLPNGYTYYSGPYNSRSTARLVYDKAVKQIKASIKG